MFFFFIYPSLEESGKEARADRAALDVEYQKCSKWYFLLIHFSKIQKGEKKRHVQSNSGPLVRICEENTFRFNHTRCIETTWWPAISLPTCCQLGAHQSGVLACKPTCLRTQLHPQEFLSVSVEGQNVELE